MATSNAETCGGGSLGHGFGGVVGSFGVDVRAQVFEQGFDARLAEQDDVIDGAKSSDKKRTCVFVKNGTSGTFQRTDAGVRVHTDDENVAFAARALEVANMADVKRIEATVGKDDALRAASCARVVCREAIHDDEFGCSAAHASGGGSAGLPSNSGEKFIASDGGGAALHNDKTTSDVGNVSGFERRGTARQGNRVRGKDSVAGAGNIDGLVATIERDLRLAVSPARRAPCHDARE